MQVRLRLFGTPIMEIAGENLELSAQKPDLLLIYLAYHNDFVSREHLAALFYPEYSDEIARKNLRSILSRARSYSWASALEVVDARIRFRLATDVQEFLMAIQAKNWELALGLYERPFLDGFPLLGVAALEEWCHLEREHLSHLWHEAAMFETDRFEREGQFSRATDLLALLLERDTLAEDVLQRFLRCAYLNDQRGLALRRYEDFRQALEAELGLEPLETTVDLVKQIRANQLTSQTPGSRVTASKPTPPKASSLVGRELELEQLRSSNAKVMLVSGEPGIGKSRLMLEANPNAIKLSCREGLEGVPYAPVLEVIKARLEHLPDLGVYLEDLARLIPDVLPGVQLASSDPQTGKSRLLEALARCFEHFLIGAGLIADDLQWADSATLEFLVLLSPRIQTQLICAYRSTEVTSQLEHTLWALRNQASLEIKLAPLSQHDTQVLLELSANIKPEFSQTIGAWLQHASGGNPFFALETLQAIEPNFLEQLSETNQLPEIPKSISQMIQKRISSLSESTQRVLQAASVIREGFEPKSLVAVVGLSEWAVIDALEETQMQGLTGSSSFVHDLTRQSIYSSLSEMRRKRLHGLVAEALVGKSESLVIAEHWLAANETEKAVLLWIENVPKLRELSLELDQIRICKKILEHSIDRKQCNQARLDCIAAYLNAGLNDEAQSQIDLGVQETDDLIALARLSIIQANAFMETGHYRKTLEMLQQFQPIPKWFDEEMIEDLRWIKGTALGSLGHYKEALELLELDHPQYEQSKPSWKLVVSLTAIGSLYDRLGQHEKALGFHQRSLQVAKLIGFLSGQIEAMRNLLFTLGVLGRSEEGIEPAEQLLQTRQIGTSVALQSNLATTYLRLGRYEEARRHYEHVIKHSHDPSWRILALGRVSNAYVALGIVEQIHPTLETAIEELSTTENPTAQGIVVLSVLENGNTQQITRIETFLQAFDLESVQPDIRAMIHQLRETQKDKLPRSANKP